MVNFDAAFFHHLFQVTVAERVSQIPADAGQDDVFFDAVTFEVDHEGNLSGSVERIAYRKQPLLTNATEPVDEPQLLGKPVLFGEAEFFDIYPVIGPANHGAEGDEENVLQLMLLLPIHSGVLNGGEMMRYRSGRFCGHWKSNRYSYYLI